MRVARIIKAQALFVGAVIGAGFATGKELVTFYGEYAMFSIFFSGILLGLMGSLFMFYGKYNCEKILPKPVKKIIEKSSKLAVVFSWITMCAGMQELANDYLNGVELALICTLIVLVCLPKSNAIEFLNNIVVLGIIVMLIFFSSKVKLNVEYEQHILRSLGYCGLNIMLGGMTVKDDGVDMKNIDILLVGILSGVVLAVLMSISYLLSIEHMWASMPMLQFGKQYGYEHLVVLMIGFSIFTTMIACARTLYAKNSIHIAQNENFGIRLVLLCLVGKALKFDACVRYFYSFIGAVGVVYLVVVIVCVILGTKMIISKK